MTIARSLRVTESDGHTVRLGGLLVINWYMIACPHTWCIGSPLNGGYSQPLVAKKGLGEANPA